VAQLSTLGACWYEDLEFMLQFDSATTQAYYFMTFPPHRSADIAWHFWSELLVIRIYEVMTFETADAAPNKSLHRDGEWPFQFG
jgi:hypothetical protein